MQPISVIIPTFNAVGQVEPLLTRMGHFREKYGEYVQVIVADDASTDGTPKELKQIYPFIDLVENKQNRGYGANAMSGAAVAKYEFLAFLNSDIELIGNPAIDLVDRLLKDRKLFAAMPLVYNRSLEKVENLQRLAPSRGLVWNTDLNAAAEWTATVQDLLSRAGTIKQRLRDVARNARPVRSLLCGAAFICRRDRFLELGGFDPRYAPFYWEDVDLDYRARRKGWHCVAIPSSLVIHRHSETIDRYHKLKKFQYLRMNQLRFTMAHLDQLPGLQAPHMWWGARALLETLRGNRELARAYFAAGKGAKSV
jgi:GT2 family glycosyltransferase